MDEKESIREVIEKYKAIYQKLQPVYSPALNEKVFFNMSGFKHLVFKKHHRRNSKVIYKSSARIKVVVRKNGIKGKYYFQSIMKY